MSGESSTFRTLWPIQAPPCKGAGKSSPANPDSSNRSAIEFGPFWTGPADKASIRFRRPWRSSELDWPSPQHPGNHRNFGNDRSSQKALCGAPTLDSHGDARRNGSVLRRQSLFLLRGRRGQLKVIPLGAFDEEIHQEVLKRILVRFGFLLAEMAEHVKHAPSFGFFRVHGLA